MTKKRVHEIAKEQGMSSADVLTKLRAAGFDVTAAASTVDEADPLEPASEASEPDALAADTEPALEATDGQPLPEAATAEPAPAEETAEEPAS